MIYALLIHSQRGEADPLPADEEEAILVEHRALQRESRGQGDLLATARLEGTSHSRTVRKQGGALDVSDGPYMESKEWLVGFYLLECENEDEAITRAERICPPDGSIEIRPVNWHALK